ncbi:hypothetical protein ABEW34_25195, partial [Paenibacillus algorifonticola]|uniref:hypothetical protein n=1 Tax=Paenibacillus algorifonticola TaxID=684063 RepID=UPI003D2A9721
KNRPLLNGCVVTSILQEKTIFLCLFLTFKKNGASRSQLSLTFWTAPFVGVLKFTAVSRQGFASYDASAA